MSPLLLPPAAESAAPGSRIPRLPPLSRSLAGMLDHCRCDALVTSVVEIAVNIDHARRPQAYNVFSFAAQTAIPASLPIRGWLTRRYVNRYVHIFITLVD